MNKLKYFFCTVVVIFAGSGFFANEVIAGDLPASLQYVEQKFPDSVHVFSDKKIEFCPDNSCDVFSASEHIDADVFGDVVFLYLYCQSDFYVLKTWRGESSVRNMVDTIVSKYMPHHQCDKGRVSAEHVSCLLHELMHDYGIEVLYGRYDESTRTESMRK